MPQLRVSPSDLTNQQIDPQEGFVLSRINGSWDIQSILSICPFREADCLRMIKKLMERGIVEVSSYDGRSCRRLPNRSSVLRKDAKAQSLTPARDSQRLCVLAWIRPDHKESARHRMGQVAPARERAFLHDFKSRETKRSCASRVLPETCMGQCGRATADRASSKPRGPTRS